MKYLIVYYTKTEGIIKAVGSLYANNSQEVCKKARKALPNFKEEMLYEMMTIDGFGKPGKKWADWLCNININDPLRRYSVGPL